MKTSANTASGWTREPHLKPIDGGYLLETCNPWLFGPGQRFIVDEEKKQELIGILKPGVGTFLFTNGIIAYICIVGGLWWAFSLRTHPDALNLLGMIITIIVPLYAASLIAVRRFLRQLQPIISCALPTHKRSSIVERCAGVGHMMSSRVLWLGLVVSVAWIVTELTTVLNAISAVRMRPHEILLYWPILQFILSAGFGAFCAWTLYRRPRATK